MKILMVHNYYAHRGGEDACLERERNLLERNDVEVVSYVRHNTELVEIDLKWTAKIALGAKTIWSQTDYRELRGLIRREKPALMHVHNSFPRISPSAYYAARHEGIPVVQTLHNYRLICPSAVLMREDRVCEDCAHKIFPWPAVAHSCYSHGRSASATVAAMIATHNLLRTWSRVVDAYIAQTEFMREKFIECGLPAARVFLKPGFVDPDPGEARGGGNYALFVGRLSAEKGVDTLLAAWEKGGGLWPLRIVGAGPLEKSVRNAAARIPGIEFHGRVSDEALGALRNDALFQVVPSIWYEGAPAVINEAFSLGLPVVASRIGSLATMIEHGRNGRHFQPGDANDLAEQVRALFGNPSLLCAMRRNARNDFLARNTAAESFAATMKIYQSVLAGRN